VPRCPPPGGEVRFSGGMQHSATIAGPGTRELDPLGALRRSFGVDVRALAALRVGLAAILLFDLALRARHLRAHYGDFGILPRSELRYLSLHALSGSPIWSGILFALAAAFAALLLVGWRTRLATAASWALLVSLHLRNPYLCDSGDRLLALLLFWGLFLPLGARASVDALRGRSGRVPEVVLSPAGAALLFQVTFVYVFSALIKDKTAWLGSGDALHYALSVDMVTTAAGRSLLDSPGLLRFASRATFLLELLGPFLCFVPLRAAAFRTAVPLVFIAFHIILAVLLDIGLFPYVCMAAWLAFLPPAFWEGIARLAGIRSRAAPVPGELPGAPAGDRSVSTALAGLLASVVFLYVFCWNIATMRPGARLPAPVAWPAEQLRLGQRWAMFALPPRDDGWWVMPARLRDGSEVDLHGGASPVVWDKPADVAATYASPRIWKWLTFAWGAEHRPLIAHYAAWLRRDWNERHGNGRAVVAQAVHYMLEETGPPGAEPVRAKLTIYEWSESAGERVRSHDECPGTGPRSPEQASPQDHRPL